MCTEIANAFCPARASWEKRAADGGEPTAANRRTTDDGRRTTDDGRRTRRTPRRDVVRRRRATGGMGKTKDAKADKKREKREKRDEKALEAAATTTTKKKRKTVRAATKGDDDERRKTKGTRTNARARSRRWARESDGRGRED